MNVLKINVIDQYSLDSSESRKVVVTILKHAYKFLKISDNMIISVIFADDGTIRKLNREYRGIDKETDVLSFENEDGLSEIGDVFISIDRAREQANAYQHTYERELAFLALHGFLHCLGYDHQTKAEEEEMFALQDRILKETKYER